MRLGIDFGTTRSVVAWCDRGNYPVISFISESGDPIEWYPSVVAENQGKLKFGFDALQVATDPDWTMVRSFKRPLSDADVSPNSTIRIGSIDIGLSELIAGFLETLRSDLITRSNLPKHVTRDEHMQAVVATPANAHSTQRFITLDAFRKAGFDVLALLNEPSAAGFEYTHRYRNTITVRREHVVVYDLGGGTFDVSLVRMSGQHHDVITTAGVGRLGGDDFDDVLVNMILESQGVQRSSLSAFAASALVDRCRIAKETLNPNSRRIAIDLDGPLAKFFTRAEASVPTAEYYDACEPLIAKSIQAMVPILNRMEADVDTDVDGSSCSDIAGIYVVGGASSLPAVGRALRKRFGRLVHRSPYPSAATAIGLAIAADESSGFALEDRFSRTFGVFREAHGGHVVSFDPILTKDMRIPKPGAPPISTSRVYRAKHNIGHFRFVECAGLEDNESPSGDITPFADVLFPFDASLRKTKAELGTIPVKRTPNDGPQIEECYKVDAHGIVELTITDVDTGFEYSRRIA